MLCLNHDCAQFRCVKSNRIESCYGEEKDTTPRPFRPKSMPKNVPVNDLRLGGTHTGPTKCCVRGSFGAEAWKVLSDVRNGADVIIEKNWFSGFTQTTLKDELSNASRVHIAGVTASTCVKATSCDAFLHGYEVCVVRDCVSARSSEKINDSLSFIQKHYGDVVNLSDLE